VTWYYYQFVVQGVDNIDSLLYYASVANYKLRSAAVPIGSTKAHPQLGKEGLSAVTSLHFVLVTPKALTI
jgi:hypothetical protein